MLCKKKKSQTQLRKKQPLQKVLDTLKHTDGSGQRREDRLSGKATLCFDIWTCLTGTFYSVHRS